MSELPQGQNAPSEPAVAWLVAGFAALDLLSWFGWRFPLFGSLLAVALTLAWIAAARRSLVLGLSLLAVELVLGSQGYLANVQVGGGIISLRFLLFGSAFSLLVARLVREPGYLRVLGGSTWWYAAALGAVAWGVGVGYLRGNEFQNLFLDANAYLYLLLYPLFVEAARASAQRGFSLPGRLLGSASLWLGLRTLILLYLFTHVEPQALLPVYHWIRQLSLGEVTLAGAGFYRIFLQSQVYAALLGVAGCYLLWHAVTGSARTTTRNFSWPLLVITVVNLATAVASLSRSFWMGATTALLLLPMVLRLRFRRVAVYGICLFLLVASAVGVVLAISRLPWPLQPLGNVSAASFAARLGVGEAAGQSRLKLLPPLAKAIIAAPVTGRGFGTTITYQSLDPRLVRSSAGGSGLVTTYAFEWGWLEQWLKLGLLGLAGFSLFLVYALRGSYRHLLHGRPLGAAFPALVALAVLHLTTPYLNHPLGLGALMLAAAAVSAVPE